MCCIGCMSAVSWDLLQFGSGLLRTCRVDRVWVVVQGGSPKDHGGQEIKDKRYKMNREDKYTTKNIELCSTQWLILKS